MTDVAGQFIEKFISLSGQACRVPHEAAVVEYILDAIGRYGARTIALGTLPAGIATLLISECDVRGITVLQPPYPRQALPIAMDTAQVGISMARNAIAETGTLIEVTTDDAERLVSALPRVYIGIVDAKSIVPGYYDAAPILREVFSDNGANCVVSFISGPSRTGDIELKLTLGVHGPEVAHAVVLDHV